MRNGYTFTIDAEGRTREVSGALHSNPSAPRARRAQTEAGGTDRRPTDHGGHYIAARFDGPTDAFNHFAQDANFNTGVYRVLEGKWAKAIEQGQDVHVMIVPSYVGGSTRPSILRVTYSINGKIRVRPFHNERRGESNG